MSDTVTLQSTTDTVEEIREALGLPADPDAKTNEPPTHPRGPIPDEGIPFVPATEVTATRKETTPAEKPEEATTEKPTEPPKKPKRNAIDEMQDRISQEAALKNRERERADKAEAELAALKAGQKPPEPPPAAPKAPEPPAAPAKLERQAKPNRDEIGTTYPTFEDFTEAMADWARAEARVDAQEEFDRREAAQVAATKKAETETAERAEAQRVFEANKTRVETFRTSHPDFDEQVVKAEWPCSNELAAHLMESEHGPAVAYHLATHREEAEALAKLPLRSMYVEVGKLEARVGAATTGTTPKPAPINLAPEPLQPVGSSPTPSVASDDDTLSYQDYKTREMARLKAQGRGV